MIGQTGLYDSQNTGQIYTGALVAVALLGFALARGALWAREIRFFTVAAVVTLLYALGKYTPLFYLLYEFLPGVALFRRPADATFVLCALLAIVAGYLVHRFLEGTLPPLRRWQHALAIADRAGAGRDLRRAGASGRDACKAPRCRSCGASAFWPRRSRRWRLRAAPLGTAWRSRRWCWRLSVPRTSPGTTRRTS